MKQKAFAGVAAMAIALTLAGCGSSEKHGTHTPLTHSSNSASASSSESYDQEKTVENDGAKGDEKQQPLPAPVSKTVQGLTVPTSISEAGKKGSNGFRYTDPRQPGLVEADGATLGSGRTALNKGFSMNLPGKPSASVCAHLAGGTAARIQAPMAYSPNCDDPDDNVSSLKWLAWDDDVAFAVGTRNINNCVPNCASGEKELVPVTVTLLAPKNGVYTEAIVDHGVSGWDKYEIG